MNRVSMDSIPDRFFVPKLSIRGPREEFAHKPGKIDATVTSRILKRNIGLEEAATVTLNSLSIWTIGHSTRTIEEFIEILHHYQIEILVDVRHFPGSRRLPHFNKAALHDALIAAGIRYEHLVELGGRRPVRPDSHNVAWRNASFRGYADYMETQPFLDGIDHLLDIARTGHTAVMCSEAVWWRCHRSMIADHLKARGVQVLHILSLKVIQEHSYTSPARLVEGRLSYEGILGS
jgi:uncharacterized protein (DUF488 family)